MAASKVAGGGSEAGVEWLTARGEWVQAAATSEVVQDAEPGSGQPVLETLVESRPSEPI